MTFSDVHGKQNIESYWKLLYDPVAANIAGETMNNRENYMLQLKGIEQHLEYDRIQEALASIKTALPLYAPPEIYENFDIESSHFFVSLSDRLPIDLRSKIFPEVKSLIKKIKDSSPQTHPCWLLDLIDLSLARFPPSEDPREIQHLRRLISTSPDSIELKFYLALRLVQDSIDRDSEEGFRECLSIFKTLYPIFSKKAEMQAHWRIHFPEDPEMLFNTCRVWAILQYSEYLQVHNRVLEVIDVLKSQTNEPWFAHAQENDKTAIRTELKLLEKYIRCADLVG